MFWFSCAAAGISLYGFVWVFTRPVARRTESAGEYTNNRLLSLVWPWVVVMASVCEPFISWRTRQALQRRLQVAGLSARWAPRHVVAMQYLLALLAGPGGAAAGFYYGDLGIVHSGALGCGLAAALMSWPRRWLRDLAVRRQRAMLREFPFLLDLTTLCVEAGLSLHGALQQAAMHAPSGPLRNELRHALADMRAGAPRAEALKDLAQRVDLPALRSLVVALGQADQLGMSLGPVLRAQSAQRRAERFLRAEKLALEAPVKMLFPMVFCIFPCTFLIIGFPIAIKLIGMDL